MKSLHIEARYTGKLDLSGFDVKKIPDSIRTIALFTTVQYMNFLDSVKEHLVTNGKKVRLLKPKNTSYPGQVLGCTIEEFEGRDRIDGIVFIGDGMFHPLALSLKNKIPVYIYNPLSRKLKALDRSEAEKTGKKARLGMIRFHSSERIGLLISTKPGQGDIASLDKLKKKHPEKSYYMLAFDTLDFTQLENFPFIECFVNCACQRMGYEDSAKFPRPVADINDLI
ncbi:diphthamide synthesis protein [Candidatus Woesearchaeota archaeon]|nr:diphthamide synthesis protein [Candidatus Woesearchaeota archaeon]